jgi:leader peptidase (prepilin peptidase) / N-methyltransferase
MPDETPRVIKRLRLGAGVFVAVPPPVRERPARRWSVPRAAAPVAAAAALVAALRLGPGEQGVFAATLLPVLVVLAAVDLRHRLVPNRILAPAFAAVLAFRLASAPEEAAQWLLAAAIAPLALLAPAIIDRRAVGMGDVKLGALLGAALGFAVVPALLVASLAVVPVAGVLLMRAGRAARRTAIPFAPFLALGAAAVLLA